MHLNHTAYLDYYRIPTDKNIAQKWTEAIVKSTNLENSPAFTKNSKICSRHFTADCFVQHAAYRKLVPGSVPSIFPYVLNSTFISGLTNN